MLQRCFISDQMITDIITETEFSRPLSIICRYLRFQRRSIKSQLWGCKTRCIGPQYHYIQPHVLLQIVQTAEMTSTFCVFPYSTP